jgi:hypothetical protein
MTGVSSAIPNNRFFSALPQDLIRSVVKYFEGEKGSLSTQENDETIAAVSAVCRDWRAAIKGNEASVRLTGREHEYPLEIRQVFQNSNQPICKLPELKLSRVSDYIDFLKPADLSDPVMKFKDSWERPGIAFHIREKRGENPGEVLAIFQRYPDEGNNWERASCRASRRISDIMTEWSSNKEKNGRALERISLLLSGQDPEFILSVPSPSPIPNVSFNRFLSKKVLIISAVAILVLAYLAKKYLN